MTGVRDTASLLAALAREDLLERAPKDCPSPSSLQIDSRGVTQGAWFLAVRGSQVDGHRFARAAVAAGAAVAVVEARVPDLPVPQVVVRDGRLAAIALARAWFGDPSRQLSLIGVTGTSGKTTTTLLTAHLLGDEGHAAGTIGTLGAYDGSGRPVPSTAGSLTTPGPVDLQATLAGMVAAGVRQLAMEASSHSLEQGRLDGLVFDGAIFTNLSREHLDYHVTMDRYREAKLRLLTLLGPGGVVAANRDDPAWEPLWGRPDAVTFGTSPAAMLQARDLVLLPLESRFRLTGRYGEADVTLPLPGEFNVSNALAAAACALGLGRPFDAVAARLADAPQVPGRMERLTDRPCVVIRDYAHKPDALERVLRTLRPITPGRLMVLFGCGGDRDRGKRPIMGQLAAELADLSIVTSDNPRTEDPDAIIDEIVAGFPSRDRLQRIADRREAIRWALDQAGPDDTLVLAGKGHETYQVIGTTSYPFDERAVVAELLEGR
ncbi:MAG TPA: UDP-N-acetylmuramoyl-L-alanyl-D-glutamate--2,6-diaminopimelate ligase [Actinotalea sp.]|nr:UDP-N-acetylmuramoyl-L-alanyl-D-glutamate--2,6-diaminopimelate ligase [Actinotalea sp.]